MLKLKLISIFLLSFFCVTMINFNLVNAKDYGLKTTVDTITAGGGDDLGHQASNNLSTTELSTRIGTILKAGLSFLGILFFGLMLYAGVTWMMARGNEQEAKKAQDTIVAAIIGLVIVMAAYAITQFVGDAVGAK